MPKTKFQDAIFTVIMALIMVYGMVVYNIALNTGALENQTFRLALHLFWNFSSWENLRGFLRLPSCPGKTGRSSLLTPFRFASAA
jgi:hypothetical protein